MGLEGELKAKSKGVELIGDFEPFKALFLFLSWRLYTDSNVYYLCITGFKFFSISSLENFAFCSYILGDCYNALGNDVSTIVFFFFAFLISSGNAICLSLSI